MAVFHALSALALAIFLAGILARVRFWLRAARNQTGGPGGQRATRLAGQALRLLLRPRALVSLFWNGVAMRQVWRESHLRWVMHLTISWSFVGLFVVGSLGNLASDLGVPLGKDDAWFATFNDAAALALVAGLALAIGRRYLAPPSHARTVFEDAAVLAFLGVLAISGLLVEAGRFLDEGTAASVGGYAFVGYPLAQAMEPLDWDWAAAAEGLWWFHAVTSLCLVAYLPYSKLLHMFTSPVTIALAGDGDERPLDAGRGAAREAEPWPA